MAQNRSTYKSIKFILQQSSKTLHCYQYSPTYLLFLFKCKTLIWWKAVSNLRFHMAQNRSTYANQFEFVASLIKGPGL